MIGSVPRGQFLQLRFSRHEVCLQLLDQRIIATGIIANQRLAICGYAPSENIARLLPVIRTFIALPAGIARMPRGRFHIYTFLGSWPWCLGLAWLGLKLGENWRELGRYFHEFDVVIGAVLALGIVWFVWSHWQNRIRAASEN